MKGDSSIPVTIDEGFIVYDNTQILSVSDLMVPAGQVTVLRGANGCGKSSLLDSMLEEKRVFSGEMKLFGQDTRILSKRKIIELGVRYLPQDRSGFERLTPYEHIQIVSDSLGDCLIPLDLNLDEIPSAQLSGGEQSLLCFQCLLFGNVRLVVLDEPFVGLDAPHIDKLVESLNILRLMGVSILMTDHTRVSADVGEVKVHEIVFSSELDCFEVLNEQ